MDNLKLNEMKRSEVLKMEIAVLEILETAQCEPQSVTNIQESGTPGKWRISYPSKKMEMTNAESVMKSLGKNFSIVCTPKGKDELTVTIEADSSAFLALLNKKENTLNNNS